MKLLASEHTRFSQAHGAIRRLLSQMQNSGSQSANRCGYCRKVLLKTRYFAIAFVVTTVLFTSSSLAVV